MEVPPDGNFVPGRLTLAIESAEDVDVKYKAHYVIGGHRDKIKCLMVDNAQTLQPAPAIPCARFSKKDPGMSS